MHDIDLNTFIAPETYIHFTIQLYLLNLPLNFAIHAIDCLSYDVLFSIYLMRVRSVAANFVTLNYELQTQIVQVFLSTIDIKFTELCLHLI